MRSNKAKMSQDKVTPVEPSEGNALAKDGKTRVFAEPKIPVQQTHKKVLIPGPTEFDDRVLKAMSHESEPHTTAEFCKVFGETLAMTRRVFQTSDPASQPFIVSGSGTLGWDMVAANLLEPNEEVLVIQTGTFGDGFARCLNAYGASVTQLSAPIGKVPQMVEISEALKEKPYSMITITHTDTSTGVLADIQAISELVHRVSPNTLVVVDGVCSVGCEDLRFDEWGLDAVLTASQKGLGCPAGLCVLMVGSRAMQKFANRSTPVHAYFAAFSNWLPVMQSYEAGRVAYFATPSSQLIRALHEALSQILAKPLEERFEAHKSVSKKLKTELAGHGLSQIAQNEEIQANGMTAVRLPKGLTAPAVLSKLQKDHNIFHAGGLHKALGQSYIRIGHMGVSVMDPNRTEIDTATVALRSTLDGMGDQEQARL